MKTVDKDVVVITISPFHKLDLEELWIEFGTGVNLEWLPIQEYAENLGESICQGMPVWFAFTGCDTVFWVWHEVGLEYIQICCDKFIQNVSYYFIIITIWLASQNTKLSDGLVSLKIFTVFTFRKTTTTFFMRCQIYLHL